MKRGLRPIILGISFLVISITLFSLHEDNQPSIIYPVPEYPGAIGISGGIYAEESNHSPNYNTTEINDKVLKEAQEYFNINNFTDYNVEYHSWHWTSSYYTDSDKTIHIGLYEIENRSDVYRTVFTHEYAHYLLHRLNITNLNVHESLADTYTWYTNRKVQEEIWGSDDSLREYPYNIVMSDVIKNYNCLNGVFIKGNKISKLDSLLDRLDSSCGFTLTKFINSV